MGVTAASVLDKRLSEAISDWLEVTVTTALTASVAVISTDLRSYDDGSDDHFNTYWEFS